MPTATPEKCRALLACLRPDNTGSNDRPTREALQRAEADAGLKDTLAQQHEFDRGVGTLIRDMPLPDGFAAQLGSSFEQAMQQRSCTRQMLRHPAFWAVLLSMAFLLAWGGMVLYQRLRGFPGDDAVNRMVTSVSANTGNQRLEPLTTGCDNLADTFFIKYGLDNYGVPQSFGHFEALGYRIFDNNSFPVAQVKVREHGLTFLIFRADQQGVDIQPDGAWKRLSGDQWAAAVQVRDKMCFVVACRGGDDQLEIILSEAESAAGGHSASR